MKYTILLPIILGGMLAANSLQAEPNQPVVKLGLTMVRGPERDVEFQQYGLMQPVFKQNNIEASLIDELLFYRTDKKVTREKLDALLAGFHVVSLFTSTEDLPFLTPEIEAHGRMVGEALAEYVKKGGGLFLTVNPVRYPKMQNEKYWNIVFEPLGIQILREGVFDATRAFEADIMSYGGHPGTFWFTRNFADSPVLQGVKGLCLPKEGHGSSGVVALKYSDSWDVIVRGEQEAKSYKVRKDNSFSTDQVGSYDAAPPVVAVRTLGEGRIVCFPRARIHTGMNVGNPLWEEIVESRGNPEKIWPSDGTRLQLNAYRWLGEPALDNEALGTHQTPPVKPIQYAESISWDKFDYRPSPAPESAVKGIIGARSNFGGGEGTVAEYVEAAKAAGLRFIVFADPLEKLTRESLQALKNACAEASKEGDFYAAPGIRYTDSSGVPWAMWGERIVFPDKEFVHKNTGKTYPLWDGKRILARGYYEMLCGGPGTGILSYKQLRENKVNPESLWWFHFYFPKVYEDNRLVEDQYHEFLFGLRDLRRSAVASFTGINSPDDVQGAADLFVTRFTDLNSARAHLNSQWGKNVISDSSSATQGPEILKWKAINSQMETNWEHTRGAQRVRLGLDATRNFHNGYDFRVVGFDTSRPIMPLPKTSLEESVNIRGVGFYPTGTKETGMHTKIMDVTLGSTDVQIASMTLDNLAEPSGTDTRPPTAQATTPRDVMENEYFRRTHRLISPRERIDWYTVWDLQRGREGRKNYRGSVNWHEGEIEFKKDVVLEGPVPIELFLARSPYNHEQGDGTVFAVAPKAGETQIVQLTPGKKEVFEGAIGAGGFISQLPTKVGYTAFFPGDDQTYTYSATFPNDPKEPGRIMVGLGHNGQEVKAGEVFKYRFAAVLFTDTQPDAKPRHQLPCPALDRQLRGSRWSRGRHASFS